MKKLFLLLVIIWMGMNQTYATELTRDEKDSIAVSLKSIQDHTELLRMQFDSLSNDADSMKMLTVRLKKNVSDFKEHVDRLWIGPCIMMVVALYWVIVFGYIIWKNITRKKG